MGTPRHVFFFFGFFLCNSLALRPRLCDQAFEAFHGLGHLLSTGAQEIRLHGLLAALKGRTLRKPPMHTKKHASFSLPRRPNPWATKSTIDHDMGPKQNAEKVTWQAAWKNQWRPGQIPAQVFSTAGADGKPLASDPGRRVLFDDFSRLLLGFFQLLDANDTLRRDRVVGSGPTDWKNG